MTLVERMVTQAEATRIRIQEHTILFDYDELNDDHVGNGSGRLPNFYRTYYDHWKYKMMMFVDSMGPRVATITEEGFTWENKDNPISRDRVNMQWNAQATCAIVLALSFKEYANVASIKNANQL